MAKQTIIRLRDDIDGTEASETVRFSWAGTAYEIDLNKKNASEFAQAVQPYVNAARRATTTTRRKVATKRSGRSDVSAVRAWAAANGYELSERGRIPNAVIEAFNAAQHSSNGASAGGQRKATSKATSKAASKAPAKRAARKPAKRASTARKATKKTGARAGK